MLSYTNIVKKAYHTAIANLTLWLFGLFVVGGFNLNFLHFNNIPLRRYFLEGRILELAYYFQIHPGKLALLSSGILLFTLGGLFITNWSRIMLTLLGQDALENKPTSLKKHFSQSFHYLRPIIQISLMTSALMLVVALALLVPPMWLPVDNSLKIVFLETGVLLFLPLAFTMSCINIFTTFYVILHKQPLTKALDLGTDFFISRWSQVLGLVAVLMVIYFASFAIGVSFIFIFKEFLHFLLSFLLRFHILPLSAIILVLKIVSSLLFWFLLAGLSVFFNQAVLVLFNELCRPLEDQEYKKGRQPMQATSV
ncbi:MAG: hypothetical protein HY918_05005 [Candidatus Doudnabacteria bacterium]|nr:hypothetical protein [Candidatus Doudnabacteria bacterium]